MTHSQRSKSMKARKSKSLRPASRASSSESSVDEKPLKLKKVNLYSQFVKSRFKLIKDANP